MLEWNNVCMGLFSTVMNVGLHLLTTITPETNGNAANIVKQNY